MSSPPLLSAVQPVEAVLRRPHGLLEGPRLTGDGAIVYSDVLAGGVWRCERDGGVGAIVPKRRGVGGIVAHAGGGWVISGRSVVHVRPDGEQRTLLDEEDVVGYNDLGVTADGRLLAGALRYRALAGEEPRNGRLVRAGADGERTVLTEDVVWPNGIGVSPDGEKIYISDYARQIVLSMAADGSDLRVFCRSPRGSADGLAVDTEGGVWVALGEGGAVARFDREGGLDEVVPLPARFVSSISFGGADMREVLITTADNTLEPELGGTVLRARSAIPGVPVAPVAI